MSSAVVKIVSCDRCPAVVRAEVVGAIPIGWARLIISTERREHDLCPECWRAALGIEPGVPDGV